MVIKKTKEVEKLGDWAFLGGLVIAVLVGLVPSVLPSSMVALVLVVLGILVGLINIGGRQTHEFLLAAVALSVASSAGLQALPVVGSVIGAILTNIVSFVAPAAIIVAVKAVYELGR